MTSAEKKEQIETLIDVSQRIKKDSEANLTAMNKAYFDKNIINNAREVNTIACKQPHMENLEFTEDTTFEDAFNAVKKRAIHLQERVVQQTMYVNKPISDEQAILALYAEVETQYFDATVLIEDCSALASRFKERPAPEPEPEPER